MNKNKDEITDIEVDGNTIRFVKKEKKIPSVAYRKAYEEAFKRGKRKN